MTTADLQTNSSQLAQKCIKSQLMQAVYHTILTIFTVILIRNCSSCTDMKLSKECKEQQFSEWVGNQPSVLRTALQPIQVLLFWANAIRPPTLEVSTVLQRVWSPSGIKQTTFNTHWILLLFCNTRVCPYCPDWGRIMVFCNLWYVPLVHIMCQYI